MKKGFSLIEIIVSVAIISILSSIGVQVFTSSVQRARFESDVATVAQALRKAQNAALSPPISEIFGTGAKAKLCSVGVRVDSSNKSIQPIYTSDSSTSTCNTQGNYSSSTILTYVNIAYTNDTVNFNLPFADSSGTTITLTSIYNASIKKEITVTSAGLIKVSKI